jgi:hypothetical protein
MKNKYRIHFKPKFGWMLQKRHWFFFYKFSDDFTDGSMNEIEARHALAFVNKIVLNPFRLMF